MNTYLKNLESCNIDYINSLGTDIIVHLIEHANEVYYNSDESIMSDMVYDALKDTLESRDPQHPLLYLVGATPVIEKMKVKLPYWMGSMDKIKPGDKKLLSWFDKYNKVSSKYIISDKLDGVSCLYKINKNERKLYTRGNGSIGYDITHLIQYLDLPIIQPKSLSMDEICVRGEIILSKEKFKKYDNSNARNLVSGLVNSKTINAELAKDVDVIMYELVNVKTKPDNQMRIMKDLGFNVVHYINFDSNFNIPQKSEDQLKKILLKRKQESPYEIDGIIVAHNELYAQNKSGNPKHSVAFKMNSQIKDSEVIGVVWEISKDGYLKPRVNIKKINLGGVNISYTTGFNGKYIEDNKIGPGAIVTITRSGDVIPYIKDVIKPALEGQMPDIPYSWTDTHVDIFLNNIEGNDDVKIKRLTRFFNIIGVESLNIGLVKKMVSVGLDTLIKIKNASIDDFLDIPGFKEKLSTKIYTNIHKIIDNPIEIVTLMVASNVFGRGLGGKKLKLIVDNGILDEQCTLEEICELDGFSYKTAQKFIDGIKNFNVFVLENGLKYYKNDIKQEGKNEKLDILVGKKVVFTGGRDKAIEKYITEYGVFVTTTVSKNTSLVVTKTDSSSKLNKAKQLGIPIMTMSEFKSKFNL